MVVVDTVNNDYCWLFIQKYVHETLNEENSNWEDQNTVTLNIPIKNTFSKPEIIEKCAFEGQSYCNLLVNGIPTHEMMMKVYNINPSLYISKEYEKIFDLEISNADDLFDDNELDESKKFYLSTYKKTLNDDDHVLNHIKAIIGLLQFYNFENSAEREEALKLIDEGIALSTEYELSGLSHYFYGLKLSKHYYILQSKLKFPSLADYIYKTKDIESNKIESSLQWELDNINKQLDKIYIAFFKNLMDTLENEEIIVFMELLSLLIRIEIEHLESSYDFTNEFILNSSLNQIEKLIKIFEKLIESFDENINYKYDIFEFKSIYYCLKKDEKCYEIIDEYIEFCNKNKSKYQLNRAESLKKQILHFLPQGISDKYDEQELKKIYKKLIEAIGESPFKMDGYANAVKQSAKDYNPERILKNCTNLELYYKPNAYGLMIEYLYSSGEKILFCKHGASESYWDLDELYGEFYNKYCKDCEYCEKRDFKFKFGENYVISDEFKEILRNKK